MYMTMKNYSKAKFYLTNSIRQLEFLLELLTARVLDKQIISEVNYWVTTLDMIRSCLYESIDEYYGKINIQDSIREVQSELTNAYHFIFIKLREKEQSFLANAWLYCKKAGEEL